MPFRLTANISFLFPDLPFLDRFAAAAAAGFDAVECHWPYEHPVEMLRVKLTEAGLDLTGINTPRGNVDAGDFGLAAVPGREEEFRESFAKAVAYAEALECPMIHVMAGIVAADRHEEACYTYIENLRHAAKIAEDKGLTILIEPINHRDAPDYFLSSLEEADAIVATVSSPALKILADLYHLQIMGGDLVSRLAEVGDAIGHVQVAAVPSRAEPDDGEVNIGFVLKALEAAGYDGLVGAEYRPRAGTVEGLGWIAAAGLSLPGRG
ncbi:hydroxypyruvate isomerase family protein [Methylobrevis pamukkalensis]|uniref:Hydroxypyruvate isomerase n=1 Tax=Methylobrevis pamukkalensis TaxID=1439726 RepID=A0A1E3GYF8_9HYPH|nr:TIM barrel protein [Methylobrevis pamukkalensis]ODN69064.1 Hydroxypyruvate isomerase [Methylobrevis pamukkalensis]